MYQCVHSLTYTDRTVYQVHTDVTGLISASPTVILSTLIFANCWRETAMITNSVFGSLMRRHICYLPPGRSVSGKTMVFSERSLLGVRMRKSRLLELARLANQNQGFRIADWWEAGEKKKGWIPSRHIHHVGVWSEVCKVKSKRPRTGGSVGWASGCYAGGREFDSGRTNTHGLKITEEKVLPL